MKLRKNKYSITIDLGTTNIKFHVFDVDKRKIVIADKYKTPKYCDMFGECFNFDGIYKLIIKKINLYLRNYECIDSIIVSSVGEAGALVDSNGNIMTPIIAWYDTRSKYVVDKLTENQKKIIYSITGLPAHSNYSISKIKWCYDNLKLPSKRLIWLNIPDLIVYKLTKIFSTEFSMASRTMAYNLKKREFSNEVLEIFDLQDKIEFPKVYESGEHIGYLNSDETIEVNHKISVRIAGHDHMAGALSVNLTKNDLLDSTGTTEGLLYINDELNINENSYKSSLSNGIFTNSHMYTLFSSIPSGGNVFQWYKELFNIPHSEFIKDCELAKARYDDKGFENLILTIPHLNGSGAPFKNTESKALMYGINLMTDRIDILLSLIVGLCIEVKILLTEFDTGQINKIFVIGPAIENPAWMQIKSDILQKKLYTIDVRESVSIGSFVAVYGSSGGIKYDKVYFPRKINNIQEICDRYKEFYIFKQKYV